MVGCCSRFRVECEWPFQASSTSGWSPTGGQSASTHPVLVLSSAEPVQTESVSVLIRHFHKLSCCPPRLTVPVFRAADVLFDSFASDGRVNVSQFLEVTDQETHHILQAIMESTLEIKYTIKTTINVTNPNSNPNLLLLVNHLVLFDFTETAPCCVALLRPSGAPACTSLTHDFKTALLS